MEDKKLRDVIIEDIECFNRFIKGDNSQYIIQTKPSDNDDVHDMGEGIIFTKDEIKSITKFLEYLIEFK